jgi:hypothetical protein
MEWSYCVKAQVGIMHGAELITPFLEQVYIKLQMVGNEYKNVPKCKKLNM